MSAKKRAEKIIFKGKALNVTIVDATICEALGRKIDYGNFSMTNHAVLITVEEGSVGGFCSPHVMQLLSDRGIFDIKVLKFRSLTARYFYRSRHSRRCMSLPN